MFHTAREAFLTPSFAAQLLISILINLGANLGIPWLTYSSFGNRKERASYPEPSVWTWSYEINSNIALDIMLSHIMVGLLMTWAGSGGAQKDVKLKKLDVLDPAVLRRWPWSWTPAAVPGAFLRGIVMAVYVPLFAGWPLLLVIWAAVGNDPTPGWPYILFKGLWVSLVLVPVVYSIVFLGAISRNSFPELDYDLLGVGGTGAGADGGHVDAGPLGGGPAGASAT